MRPRSVLAAALVAAAGLGVLAGCQPAAPAFPDDALPDVPDQVGKADQVSRPVGTFASAAPGIGEVAQLILDEDRSYSRRLQQLDCVNVRTCGAQTGRYRYSKGGETRYIRFYDEAGQFLDRYAYQLDGPTLRLRADGSTVIQSLKLVAPPAAGQPCGGAGGLTCAGGLVCDGSGGSAGCADCDGVCVQPPQGLGRSCGGLTGLGCQDGLVCDFSATPPGCADCSGTCVAPDGGSPDGGAADARADADADAGPPACVSDGDCRATAGSSTAG